MCNMILSSFSLKALFTTLILVAKNAKCIKSVKITYDLSTDIFAFATLKSAIFTTLTTTTTTG